MGVVRFILGLWDFRVWGVAKFNHGVILGLVRFHTSDTFPSGWFLKHSVAELQEDHQGVGRHVGRVKHCSISELEFATSL